METLLSGYLRKKDISQTDFAREHGLPQAMVSEWCNGFRRPGLAHALTIEKATRGAVPALYWTTLKTRRRAS